MNNEILQYLLQYGYIAIFIIIFLGVLMIPLPIETFMIVLGTLIGQGKLHFIPTLLCSIVASLLAMIAGYYLGNTLGDSFLYKITALFKIKESTVHSAQQLFKKYGKFLILFGLFIPGIRHFVSFSAGVAIFSFRLFLLFSLIGSVLWCTIFFTAGHTFSHYFHFLLHHILWLLPLCTLFIILYFAKHWVMKHLSLKTEKEYD